MSDARADYGEISRVYDIVRRGDKPHVEWWLKRLAEAGELGPEKCLLDIGCGTGRWAIPLAQRTGCAVIGVDKSPEMLAKAKEKDSGGRCTWLSGDAHDPPVSAGSCDCVLMSLMLHHLGDVAGAFRAAFDRLRPNGIILIRQSPLEQVADDSIHRFFPETLAIERQRLPLRKEIEFWLEETGFQLVAVEPVRVQTTDSLEDWSREIELRVPSILRTISDEVYQRGLARCRQFMREHPDDSTLLEDTMTLFVGRKPQ